MAIKDYLKNVAGAVLQPVAKSLWGVNPNWSVGVTMMSDRVFRWDLSGYSAYSNKIFYTGANIIVRKMTEAPITFNTKKKEAKKSINPFYSKNVSNQERKSLKSAVLDELVDHQLSELFTIELMEDFWHNYNYGDGFLWFEALSGEFSRNNKPTAVYSLKPDRVTVMTNENKFDNVDHYIYTCLNGENIRLEKDDVLHMKHWNPNIQSLKGYGVDIACAKDIALNNAGNEAEGAAFVNGGRGTLFSSKADVTAEGKVVNKLSKEQALALKDTVMKDMAGSRNNRKMKFTNGEVVVTPYGDTLAEMEINKSEDSRWKNIFAIQGIPWALTPVASQSSENSVIVGYKALVTNLIISELRKFDQMLTRVIRKWWPEIVALSDLTEFSELAPDLKLMKEVYGTPSLTEDERRSIFGYDELTDKTLGSAILVPSGLMKLEDIISAEFENGIQEGEDLNQL